MKLQTFLLIATPVLSSCSGTRLQPNVSAGASTLQPTITPPTPDTLRASFQLNSDMYISIDDPTYLANAQLVLGRVAVVERSHGSCDNGVFRITNERITGVTERNEAFTPIPITPAVPPRLLGTQVVTQGLTANVSALSFLSAQVDAESVLSVAMSLLSVARYDDTRPIYSRARDQWRASHRNYFDAGRYCRVLVVMGVVQQEWIIKKYTKVSTSAAGGAFGVSVSGSAYSGDNSMQAIYRFGLSLDVLESPETVSGSDGGVSDASVALDAAGTAGATDAAVSSPVIPPSGSLRELLDGVTRRSSALRVQ